MSEKPALCNGKCVGADYRCCFLTEDFGCQLEHGRECAAAVREAEFMQVMGGVTPGELLVYLRESGYFEAPASLKYHGAYDGGLFDHSRAVTDALIELTERLGLSWEKPRSPYVVGMFHDLCKLDDYKRGAAGWEYRNASLIPGHAEKSLCIIQRFMTLTEEEMLCIRWHMGAFDDKEKWAFYGRAIEKYPNVLYTHTADMIASRIMGV